MLNVRAAVSSLLAYRPGGGAVVLSSIVLAGLALRVAWALHMDTFPLGGDPGWYASVANNLVEGRGYAADHEVFSDQPILAEPTAFWPPAYPALLAALWKVTGVSVTAAKLLNASLGALTIVFVYALGRRLFDQTMGLLAAAAFALLPNNIAWLPALLSEPLFTLLFVAALWLLVAGRPGGSRSGRVALVGFALVSGAAVLTRGQGLLLLPIALVFWYGRDGARNALAQAGLALLIVAAVATPWTVRNWVVLGSPIPVASSAGINLRMGHAPDSTGTFFWPTDPVDGVDASVSRYNADTEVRGYRVYTQRALRYAIGHPLDEVRLAKDKILHVYRSDTAMMPTLTTLDATPVRPASLERVFPWLLDASYYGLIFLAVASAPLWVRRDPYRLLPVSVVLFWTLFHVAFFGEARFHLPLLPIFGIAAVAGVAAALKLAPQLLERARGGGLTGAVPPA